MHNRRTWIQCQSQQMLRTGAEPAHTRQCPATQRRLHCRCPAAESLRNPCDGWHETFSQEMDCSKPSEPHCTWCAKSKMTLASGRLPQFQCRQKSSNLQNNAHNMYKAYNRKNRKTYGFLTFQLTLIPQLGNRTQVNRPLGAPADRWAKDILMINGL